MSTRGLFQFMDELWPLFHITSILPVQQDGSA